MTRTIAALAVVAAAALALPAAAGAHVTVNPREAVAGAYTKLDVRVPNERDDASTVEVRLQLPDGFATASYEPRPGWSVDIARGPLAEPVEGHDGPVTEGVKEITWKGTGAGAGRIAPGQFVDFPVSVRIPESAAGRTLTFKAIQTYSSGEVVRWIGDADSETPAATVQVAAPAQEADDDGDGGADALGIVALVLGAAALPAAVAALVVARRAA